jgi:hypothetical protein
MSEIEDSMTLLFSAANQKIKELVGRLERANEELSAARLRIERLEGEIEQLSGATGEKRVKEMYPFAHCAPHGQATYPDFYIIRRDRQEWTATLGAGRTPAQAWVNVAAALNKQVADAEARGALDGNGVSDE